MPNPGTGGNGGFWPDNWHDWNDLMAQEESDTQLKEENASTKNRAKIRPSAQEISRMELAITWPGRYILEPGVARLVQRVTLARSRHALCFASLLSRSETTVLS
jgi:hypothetical protein